MRSCFCDHIIRSQARCSLIKDVQLTTSEQLQDVLPIKQVALQRRQVGLLADIFLIIRPVFAAIIGAVAGTGSAKMYEAYRAPMNDLNQAVDPTSASAIAFITSAKASPTILSAV